VPPLHPTCRKSLLKKDPDHDKNRFPGGNANAFGWKKVADRGQVARVTGHTTREGKLGFSLQGKSERDGKTKEHRKGVQGRKKPYHPWGYSADLNSSKGDSMMNKEV